MAVIYDPKKNERNIVKHGLSFERAAEFDLAGAVIEADTRADYGETRLVATGFLADRLHVLCFVEIEGGDMRVISFRMANKREARKYEQDKATHQR